MNAELVPAELVALISEMNDPAKVGEPEIFPFVELSSSPGGSVEVEKVVALPSVFI